MKKTVVLQGPVLTQSGYGVHSRQVARWLLSKPDLDVKFVATPWGDTPWVLSGDAFDGLAGQIMQRTTSPDAVKGADVALQLQLPNEWNPTLGKKNIGITAAMETDRCNPQWIECCNKVDAVIVPSEHSKLSLTNTGAVTKPLFVVPESFSDALKIPDEELPAFVMPRFSTDFNFLIFGQLTGTNPLSDRKNIFYTIKWICEAFKDHKDVGIVLKTNIGRNSRIDKGVVTNLMKQLLSEVRPGNGPKLHLVHGEMNDQEVASLYRHDQIKALVALTRGEGYGLPILEAAASGLPVIATNWSGHLDFLKLGKFISVNYQLADVHPSRIDGKIFVKGARWAMPSEDDFKKRALKFKESPTTPREWANELKAKVHEKLSFEAISKAYDSTLTEFL